VSVHRQIALTLPVLALAATLLASCAGGQGLSGVGVTGQASIADAHSTYQVGAVGTAAAVQSLAKTAVVGLRLTAVAEEAARTAAIARQTATAEALAAQVARVHAQATAAAQAIGRAHAAETAAAKAQATAAARPHPTPTRPPTLKPTAAAKSAPTTAAAPKPTTPARAQAHPTAVPRAQAHPTAVPRAQLTQAAAALAESKTLLKYRVALGASILQIGRVSDDLLRAAKLIHPRQPDFNPIALVKAGKFITSAQLDLEAAGKKLPGAKAPADYLTIRAQIAAAIAAYSTSAMLLDSARVNTGQGKRDVAIKQVADAKAIIGATNKSIAAVNSQINQLG
jgi:hypothetical protein